MNKAHFLMFMMDIVRNRLNHSAEKKKEKAETKNPDTFYDVPNLPPFNVGDRVLCEGNEIFITGFQTNSSGKWLISGESVRPFKAKNIKMELIKK